MFLFVVIRRFIMKAVFLVETEIPETDENPSEWLKQLIGTDTKVKQLRYQTLSEYDDAQDEYWRWG